MDRPVLSLPITVLANASTGVSSTSPPPRPPLHWTDRLFWVAFSRAWSAGVTSSSSSSRLPWCAGTGWPFTAFGLGVGAEHLGARPSIVPLATSSARWREPPSLGRSTHPWRTPQARHRNLRAPGVALDAAPAAQALSDVTHLPHQSRRHPRLHRFLHGPDRDLSCALRLLRWLASDSAVGSEESPQILREAGVQPLLLPARSPNLNAYSERSLGSAAAVHAFAHTRA